MIGPNGVIFCILAFVLIILIIMVARMLSKIEDLVMEIGKTRCENVVLKKLLDYNGIEWRSEDNGKKD